MNELMKGWKDESMNDWSNEWVNDLGPTSTKVGLETEQPNFKTSSSNG